MPVLVNGEQIPESEIAREAEALRRRLEQIPPAEREARGLNPAELEKHWWEWACENLIERAVLRQEAVKDSTPISAEALAAAARDLQNEHGEKQPFRVAYPNLDGLQCDLMLRLRLERLLERVTAKIAPLKQKEIAAYYRKHREQFALPERVHASHMVKNVDGQTSVEDARSAMEQAARELQSGRAFEDVADQYSDCAGNGGDLGWFSRGAMVDEFEEVVFSLPVGGISPVFRTPFGFHIAKVKAREPAGMVSLSEVNGRIANELLRQKQIRAVEDFVDRLKARAVIQRLPHEASTGTAQS